MLAYPPTEIDAARAAGGAAQAKNKAPFNLGYSFALLGLRLGESKVATIRNASTSTAARVRSCGSEGDGNRVAMLSEVAVNTYRLLDPRRRGRSYERVQLCVPSEQDADLQQASRRSLFETTEFIENERQLRLASRELVKQLLDTQPAPVRRHRVGSTWWVLVIFAATIALTFAVALS